MHSCAILDNGELKCWGENGKGQLGQLGTTDSHIPPSTAVNLGTGRTAVAVSAGVYHTCAILDNGDVKCWGSDYRSQLGNGATSGNQYTPPNTAIDLGTGRTAVALSAGYYHGCAILDNGDLKCWGWDQAGQLGDGGTNTDQSSPTLVNLGTGRTAVAVSAGHHHTCAILDNGELKCWGLDDYGQLGNGGNTATLTAPSTTAIDLGTGRTAIAVTAATYSNHTCAILDNGDMKCWGRNNGETTAELLGHVELEDTFIHSN